MSVTGSATGAQKKARPPKTSQTSNNQTSNKKKNRKPAVPAQKPAAKTAPEPSPARSERPPLPRSFRVATAIVAVEAAFTLCYALYLTFASAFGHPRHRNQGIAEGLYLLVLGIGVALAVYGMFRGRRWSRSPAITVNLIVVGLGYWLVTGSGRYAIGAVVTAIGVASIAILVTPTVHKALEAGRE